MMGLQSESASFADFRLYPSARVLEKDGVPIVLGDRALDILIVLVERAGEIVSHKDLIARVWRGLVVEPGNLRVHMTSLRKTLGESAGKERYIANVPGVGYTFVAPVVRDVSSPPTLAEYPCGAARQRLLLPPPLSRMVGREAAVETICADVIADRFVTIVGPGGMGKTTVATAVAHALAHEFSGAVCFVDISSVSEPALVVATIASTLGLTVQNDEVLPALLKCLQSLRVLLVLDNCEHVIDATAQLAERIFNEAPSVHILATSREALRAEGEHTFWLPPISSPPINEPLSASAALQFPAVRLFMERAAAGGARVEVSDTNAALVADICARLDGLALAIEIAAGRIATHGIAATAELVKKRIGLHWRGRRTAPPRHQTLQALLDWSYESLSERERAVLRRLSVFVGAFTYDAALEITGHDAGDESLTVVLDGLLAKSLLSIADSTAATTRYRLLETTRGYLLEKLIDSGEADVLAHRHAQYVSTLLQHRIASPAPAAAPDTQLGNIRAALEWCYGLSDTGERSAANSPGVRDVTLAVQLAAGAAPVLLELSLLHECQKWSTAALGLLDDETRGTPQEMVLQEARAISSTWAAGNCDGARSAIVRAIVIARDHGMTAHHLRLLVGMHIFLLRLGDLRGTAAVAEAFANAVRDSEDPAHQVITDWLLGSSQHVMGHQGEALQRFRRSFSCGGHAGLRVFGLDYQVRALVTFDRVLWLSGFADEASRVARQALGEAAKVGTPLNICFAYVYTAPLFIWCGDYATAQELLSKLMAHPNWHALPSLHATAYAIRGELLIEKGDAALGVEVLQSALRSMEADQQGLLQRRAVCALAEGLIELGKHDEALDLVRRALTDLGDGECVEYPELLRLQASTLLASGCRDEAHMEALLTRAARIATGQHALAWQLRIAMTHARLRIVQDRAAEARALLACVYDRFTEGFGTKDLIAARTLLDEITDPETASASQRKSA